MDLSKTWHTILLAFGLGRSSMGKYPPNSRAPFPTLHTICPDGVSFWGLLLLMFDNNT